MRTTTQISNSRTFQRAVPTALTILLLVWSPILEAQITIDDGPAQPLSLLRSDRSSFPSPIVAPVPWGADALALPVIGEGQVVTASDSVYGDMFQFDVQPIAEVIASGDELGRPTGIAENPVTGHLWIVDYENDRVLGWDPDNELLYVVSDDAAFDGPWGIGFMGRGGFQGVMYGGGPAADVAAVVTNRDNNSLVVLDADGTRERTFFDSHGRLDQPTGVGESWNYNQSTHSWAPSGAVAIANYGADNILSYHGCSDWRCLSWYSTYAGIDGPIALLEARLADGYAFLVANANTHNVVQAFRGGFVGPGGVATVVGPAEGLYSPTSIFAMNPMVDPLNPHPRDYLAQDVGHRVSFYVTDSGNDRVVQVSGEDGSVSDFLSGLDSPTGLHQHYSTGDLYVITANPTTGTASLVRYRSRSTLEVQWMPGADDYVFAGVHSGDELVGSDWVFGYGFGRKAMTATVSRFESFQLFVGRLGAGSVEGVELVATTDPNPVLSQPSIKVTAGGPGALEVTVEHPPGPAGDLPEGVALFMLTGCHSLLESAQYRTALSVFGYTTFTYPFPHPRRPSRLSYEHVEDCLQLAGFFDADPSGTTTAVLDDIPWVPEQEYCLVAMTASDTTGTASELSMLDALDSCRRTPTATRSGIFCTEALPAQSWQENGSYPLLPTGSAGQRVWHSYTAQGTPGEPRHLIIWVDDSEARDTLISVYNYCPTVPGSETLGQGQGFVDLWVSGGQEVRFESTHFETFPTVLRMLDLGPDGLAAPTDVTASTSLDGEIELSWTGPVWAAGGVVDPRDLSYLIEAREQGAEVWNVVQTAWRSNAFTFAELGPNEHYEFQVSALYEKRVIDTQTLPIELVSQPSESASGQTSAVDTTTTPLTLSPPTELSVVLPTVVSTNEVGIQLWWDAVEGADRYRIVQTDVGSGVETEYIVTGGALAADLPLPGFSSVCYDIRAEYVTLSGDTIESESVGWSDEGSTAFCVNLCDSGFKPIDLEGVTIPVVEPFRGPARNYRLDTGNYTGQYYAANYSGQPVRLCAWLGCDPGATVICQEPDRFGNTQLDFSVDPSTEVFIQAEYIAPSEMTPEEQRTIGVPLELGRGVATNTESPQVELTVTGAECATQITIDYLVTNWVAGGTAHVDFVADGVPVATRTEASGRLDLAVPGEIGLHDIAVRVFETSSELSFVRHKLVPTTRMLADVNYDCELDVLDAVIMIRFILGIQELLDTVRPVADANEDGFMDILDVVHVVASILDNSGSEG